MSYLYNLQGFSIGSARELSDELQSTLLGQLTPMPNEQGDSSRVLAGRGSVRRLKIPELGAFVVKTYIRGGLLRKLPWAVYLGFGKFRSQLEYQMLLDLLQLGISVPRPLAWVGHGYIFKKAWLILEEILNERNLADLSLTMEEDAQTYCRRAAEEVRKLIRSRIWHVDLHPGNVLIDHQGEVYLIDFDKAMHFHGSLNRLRDLYICRWRRAVLKYGLPEYLVELFAAEVRQDYELRINH